MEQKMNKQKDSELSALKEKYEKIIEDLKK